MLHSRQRDGGTRGRLGRLGLTALMAGVMVCASAGAGCGGGEVSKPAASGAPERFAPADPVPAGPEASDDAVRAEDSEPLAPRDKPATAAAEQVPSAPETTGSTNTTGTTGGSERDATSGGTTTSEGANADETGDTTGAAGGDETPAADAATVEPPLTKVLLLGDSLIATGFGVRLESLLDKTPGVVAYRKGKSASGLARPDFFDWMREAQHQIAAREPDVVIILMGGNDGQDLTSAGKSKRRVRWKSNAWNDAYAGRVDELLARTWAPGRTIIWLGLPKMGLGSLERKLALIRTIQQSRVKTRPGAVYMETTPHLLNSDGELKVYGIVRGKRKALRADDGIHFTMAGSDYLADAILEDVLRSFGYQPPKAAQKP